MFPYRPTKPASTAEASGKHRGLMRAQDKRKLDGILSGASNVATPTLDGLMAATDKSIVDRLFSPPRVKLRNSADISIPAGTALTTLTWDIEDYDTNGMHDAASPSRITIIRTGLYGITTAGYWGNGSGGTLLQRVFLNNGTLLAQSEHSGAATFSTTLSQTERKLNTGDYVEVQVRNTGTAAVTYYMAPAGVHELTNFLVRWICD